LVVIILINAAGIVGRWLGPPPSVPTESVVSRIQLLADTADLWAGAWFDKEHRVLWTATQKQTHALCAEPPSQWPPDLGGEIGGCYQTGADIIVLPVDASTMAIDHEWCHRVAGWRHLPGKGDNEGWPAACEARPWRYATASGSQSNAR